MTRCKRTALILLVGGLAVLVLSSSTAWLGWSTEQYAMGVLAGAGAGSMVLGGLLWFAPADLLESATPALKRRYYREFAPPMIAYFLLMPGWKILLRNLELPWLRVAVALLPAALLLFAIRAVARYVRDSDEMQRRIELESIGIAAGLVCMVSMTAGFLQSAKMIDVGAAAAMLWVFPLLCLFYGVAKIVIARRYA